jgi:hypothetical protein
VGPPNPHTVDRVGTRALVRVQYPSTTQTLQAFGAFEIFQALGLAPTKKPPSPSNRGHSPLSAKIHQDPQLTGASTTPPSTDYRPARLSSHYPTSHLTHASRHHTCSALTTTQRSRIQQPVLDLFGLSSIVAAIKLCDSISHPRCELNPSSFAKFSHWSIIQP